MLDTPEQAERFNRRLINACVRAQAQPEPVRPGQLHVTIIGAGATGTELSAELHNTARGVVAFGLDKIDPDKDIKITLVEAAPRIVPALPERSPRRPPKFCTKLNVDIRTGARVTRVTADGVELRTVTSFLRSSWFGPRASRDRMCSGHLDGLEVSQSNTLVVKPTLQTTRDRTSSRSAIAPISSRRARPTPFRRARRQPTRWHRTSVARSAAQLDGEPLEPFVYRDFGSLVSLGHYSTVGSLMGFVTGRKMLIEGFFAKMMYRSLYKMHEWALHGFWKVSLDSVSRLLTRRTEPHVKLH